MTAKLIISRAQLDATLRKLRAGGERGEERMVAWLGRDARFGGPRVLEVYEPEQVCRRDRFHIPPVGMNALMQTLGRTRSKILAQVHTHPGVAFHSEADAAWAIVRHRGALSLVLPDFARTTSAEDFLERVKTFELSHEAEWCLVPNSCLEILP